MKGVVCIGQPIVLDRYPVRIQVELSEELHSHLAQEARAKGLSMAEIVRQALAEYFSSDGEPHPDDPIWAWGGASEVCGSSGITDLAANHDRYLYEEVKT